MSTLTEPTPIVVYPDSDGKPMAENTLQARWIVTVHGGLDSRYRDDPNVFVAMDLFWYPVEGDNRIRQAPDVMVAFGRPKGERGSYRQWEEGGIAPQVVFEILSPGNRRGEMAEKFLFYERWGVEEYYVFDPDRHRLEGAIRRGNILDDIPELNGWVSPRLDVRFDLGGDDLVIYHPDGRPFQTFCELAAERDAIARRAAHAEQQAAHAEERANRLAEKLRSLGIEPNGG